MSRRSISHALIFVGIVYLGAAACAAQTQGEGKPTGKADPEAVRKYAGRYELEVGLIPVSTLDVTLEGGELFVKPSLAAKRKLIRRSKNVFRDEVSGARYRFQADDEGNIVSLTFPYEGAEYTAARVRLPPPSTSGNTTFRLKGHPDAQVVALAGSFNQWNQSQLLFAREGDEWVCRIDLDAGRYTYKFIVDGNWLLDPSNPQTEEDAAGNVNNVLEVAPR